MNKKITVLILSTMLFALSFSAHAQQPGKVPRIGYLSLRSGFGVNDEAFRQSLRELGYSEGQNIVVEWRFVDGKSERYHDFAAELVRLKVDAIVTASGDDPIIAAMNVTKTIPIIITTGSDPVARGFVASLARPGGNVTGLSFMLHELSGKAPGTTQRSCSQALACCDPGGPRSAKLQRADERARGGCTGARSAASTRAIASGRRSRERLLSDGQRSRRRFSCGGKSSDWFFSGKSRGICNERPITGHLFNSRLGGWWRLDVLCSRLRRSVSAPRCLRG